MRLGRGAQVRGMKRYAIESAPAPARTACEAGGDRSASQDEFPGCLRSLVMVVRIEGCQLVEEKRGAPG